MPDVTSTDLVKAIDTLPKDKSYSYINPQTKGVIEIYDVQLPEGPIEIKRFDPEVGGTSSTTKVESMSKSMILRIANRINKGEPFNIDMILGASYNTRSVFESLLAHTPKYHVIYPGRIEYTEKSQKMKKGHKHLVYEPFGVVDHNNGEIHKIESTLTMAVLPSRVFVYDDDRSDADLLNSLNREERGSKNQQTLEKNVTLARIHAQMQVALFEIGQVFGCKTFIAKNDQSIKHRGKKLSEYENIIKKIMDVRLLSAFPEADKTGELIDCIWFKGDKEMPAVFEVENSTGVSLGLLRMKNFKESIPLFPSKYIIVAPDGDRNKVVDKSNKKIFEDFEVWYFSYSAVMELYALCKNWKIQGISDAFLESFMEKIS